MEMRPARADEAAAVAALVRAAYAPWVKRIGREPLPMRDDYAARIAAGQCWVADDGADARARAGSGVYGEGAGVTRGLIVTADDFGLAPVVNQAVEQAHREGILTAASLMVGEPGVADAVAIARRHPSLAVGLHLTLTNGTPVSPPERIPALVRADGRLRDDMAALGAALAISSIARTQLHVEIAAQFAAFAATGLACDHVNAHKHFHLHPMIARAAIAAARKHGVRCVRIPWERSVPGLPYWPMTAWLRRLATRHGLRAPDRVVGLAWSGAFTAERLLGALSRVRPGVTEIYLHPATAGGFPGAAAGYRYADELAALVDRRVMEAAAEFRRGGYAAMLG